MSNVVPALVRYVVRGRRRWLGGFSREGLEVSEDSLDGIEVGTVGRAVMTFSRSEKFEFEPKSLRMAAFKGKTSIVMPLLFAYLYES